MLEDNCCQLGGSGGLSKEEQRVGRYKRVQFVEMGAKSGQERLVQSGIGWWWVWGKDRRRSDAR
jgi:hypothetical protein